LLYCCLYSKVQLEEPMADCGSMYLDGAVYNNKTNTLKDECAPLGTKSFYLGC
jgi:hypothetical protein